MYTPRKKSGIVFIIAFFILAALVDVSSGTEGKNPAAADIHDQSAVKKFKIHLGPPPAVSQQPKKVTPPLVKKASRSSSEIVFVLDNSGSMKKNDPERITREVVTDFIHNAKNGSRIGMVIFGKEARILQPITAIEAPETRTRLINSLEKIDYRGQFTNTPAGIERAIYELKANPDKKFEKAIILLTDGIIDTGDKKRDAEEETWLKEQLAMECQTLGIKIYGIAFTDNADFRLMQILASKTGGEYFRIYKPEEIQSVFKRIDEQVARAALNKDTASKTSAAPETKPENPPAETEPKKPTLRSSTPPSPTAPVTPVSTKWNLGDILPIILLAAIILAVLALFLMMYRTSRRDVPPTPFRKGNERDTSRRLNPEVQAELIDVDHIIPQDSVSLTIDKASISIGRDSSNDIVIPEKIVSSLHATIEYRKGYYFLEDNRSTNGTRLNSRRLDPDTKMKLKSGDIIHFAKSEFRFLIHDQAPYGETMVLNADEFRS